MTDDRLTEARARLEALLAEGERCLCMTPGGEAFVDLRVVLDSLPRAHTPTDDEREALIEKIRLAGHLSAQVMVFQGDTYPVKAIPYTSFLHILDGFRRSEPEPSAPMSLADDPMRAPFQKKRPEPQGEPSDEEVDAAADAMRDRMEAIQAYAGDIWPFMARVALHAAREVGAGVVAEEPEWEYGIAYAPGNEEFEGQDLATIQRRVKYIRRTKGYYSATVHAVRRRPAGDSVPVTQEGADDG